MTAPDRPTPTGEHWLTFDPATRDVTGCACGFRADLDSDCGWGDSVVAHLLDTGRGAAERERERDTLCRSLLDPHMRRIRQDATRIQRDAHLPRSVLRVVVPADWPAEFDGAQVYGMGCARGDVTEPTVEVRENVRHLLRVDAEGVIRL